MRAKIGKLLSILYDHTKSDYDKEEASKILLESCKSDNDWSALYPSLYYVQSAIADSASCSNYFFNLIAKTKSIEFTIYLLSPYIYEIINSAGKLKKDLITSSVTEAIKKSYKDDLNAELIDELEHLVSHHSKDKRYGKDIVDCIAKGVTNAISSECATFDDVTTIRQAYWNKQQYTNVNYRKTDRTIRINGLPFAEGVFVYLMAHYAHEYGINLKIENIPWQDIGTALLTNRIDVAIHNDSIKNSQLRGRGHLANNRILFRTEERIFQYTGYSILGREPITRLFTPLSINKDRIAVVQNSDHEHVFLAWYAKEKTSGALSVEKRWLPVHTPDAAVEAVVNGEVNFCLVGALHKDYAQKEFEAVFKNERSLPCEGIDLYCWSVSHRKSDSNMLLNDLVTLWTEMVRQWNHVKHSQGESEEELRNSCVAFVNGQPNKGFIEREFKDGLQKFIDEHDTLYSPMRRKIKSESVEGWRWE